MRNVSGLQCDSLWEGGAPGLAGARPFIDLEGQPIFGLAGYLIGKAHPTHPVLRGPELDSQAHLRHPLQHVLTSSMAS